MPEDKPAFLRRLFYCVQFCAPDRFLGSALCLQREKNRTKAERPERGGWKGLIFLHPLSKVFRRFLFRKNHSAPG